MTVPAGLIEELDLLRARRRSVQASLADRDDGPGDMGDDALYLELADELARLDDRIEVIERELHEPTPDAHSRDEHLARGTRVRLRYADGGEEEMRVGDAVEAEDEDILTADSPLGLALVGRRPGDHVSWSTPDGTQTAEVLAVTPPG
ncbi:GreA/GreB family elongation factor [Pseudonocardia saturnea]